MQPIATLTAEISRRIEVIFTDIDDTLTWHGRIPAAAFEAIWAAHGAGIEVIPVTGRPAGWCDHIARMWPVAAVVGENGALAFALMDGRMKRLYSPRPVDSRARLEVIKEEILAHVPGCRVSADQAYREYDLAIDFCEEVEPLTEAEVDQIEQVFRAHGATAKVSSIHVNGWFGEFDKLTMCLRCWEELWGRPLDPTRALFVGDSPNDVPMFAYFPHSVGVANVQEQAHRMDSLPTYVTQQPGGEGFAELVRILLACRQPAV